MCEMNSERRVDSKNQILLFAVVDDVNRNNNKAQQNKN